MRETAPRPPRRMFLASVLSALVAGGAAALVSFGMITAPETDSFGFSRSTNLSIGEEARLRSFLIPAVQDERVAVIAVGHTGTRGDPAANRELSENRAAVVERLARALGIDETRIRIAGVGGSSPLPRPEGQSDRSYEGSLARVEVTLQVRR